MRSPSISRVAVADLRSRGAKFGGEKATPDNKIAGPIAREAGRRRSLLQGLG
jgi:hypothetical protein